VLEWFWRGEALANVRAAALEPGEEAQLLASRARASADVANVTLTADPLDRSARGIACELYRESVFWAASASSFVVSGNAPEASNEAGWASFDDSIFLPLAQNGETPEVLRERLRAGSFVRFAELGLDEQSLAIGELRAASAALLAQFDGHFARSNALRGERRRRLGLLGFVLVGTVFGVPLTRAYLEHRSDLAAGRPWRTSSSYEVRGCLSPEQDCPSGYFFHTAVHDKNPWVEFDLGRETPVSRVRVENRTDCCLERAVPLGVELSRNRHAWQTVARRDEVFNSWQASFEPVTARYVRLRLMRPGILHLSHVGIYP
jgi:hypothetical protein